MKIAIVIIALPMVYNVCFVDNPSVFEPKTLSRINAIPMTYKTKMKIACLYTSILFREIYLCLHYKVKRSII